MSKSKRRGSEDLSSRARALKVHEKEVKKDDQTFTDAQGKTWYVICLANFFEYAFAFNKLTHLLSHKNY